MGTIKIGNGVKVDVPTLFKTRALITANSGGGKSYLIRVLLELLSPNHHCIVIDPEGEFKSIRDKFDFAFIGEGGEAQADVRSAGLLAERLLEHRFNAICDISELEEHLRAIWVRNFLKGLMNAPKRFRHHVVLVLDEAQLYAPESGKSEAFQAVIDLCTRGRKRGLCAILATQRLADLSKKATAQLLNRLVGPTFEDVDLDRAVSILSVSRSDAEKFREEAKVLEPGNFYALGRAISKHRILFKVREAVTSHPEIGDAVSEKVPALPPARLRELLPKLSDLPKEAEEKQKTEAELRQRIRQLEAEVRAKPPASAPPAAAAKISVQVKQKVVKVPAITEREAKEIHKLVERIEKQKGDLGWSTQRLEIAASAIRASVSQACESTEKADRLLKSPPAAIATNPLPGRLGNPPARRSTTTAATGDGEGVTLVAGERKMLQVLAQFSPGTRTKSQLGILSGYSPKGGTFGTYLSTLRKNGLVSEGMVGELKITEAGFHVLGTDIPAPPTSPDALLAMWRGKLLQGERKMLDVLVEAHPNPMSRTELGERSGYSADGGTFGTYLSTLRRNDLAVVAKDSVVASETLFEMHNA